MENKDIKEVHVFSRGLKFAVIVYVKDDGESAAVRLMEKNLKDVHYSTEEMCRWCIAHGLEYRIFITEGELKNPIKRLRYGRIMRRLRVQV